MADLYRQRWQIETFFRWIKQNLKIKAFYGTSENAVLIQIWTAMIAYLLLLWLKLKSRAGWSILELTRLVKNLIMERCNLWALLCPRTSDPPDCGQLTLFNLGGAYGPVLLPCKLPAGQACPCPPFSRGGFKVPLWKRGI